ncbi:MAG: hypothetical protein U1E45_10100 [Geminicoccaceae bacterium]
MASTLGEPAALFAEHTVDEGMVLLHRPSGRVLLLNPVAARFWAVRHKPSALALAAADLCGQGPGGAAEVRRLLEEWSSLDGLRAPPSVADDSPIPAPAARPALDRVYALGPRPARVVCDDAEVAASIEAMATAAASSGDAAADLVLRRAADGDRALVLVQDGHPVHRTLAPHAARWTLLRRLWTLCNPGRTALGLLHASAVAGGRGAVVLAGTSGSGKTTLTLACTRAGLCFVADDLTPLLPPAEVSAVPLAASLKASGWPVTQALFPEIEALTPLRSGGQMVRYFLPEEWRRAPAGSAFPVRACVFPEFTPGAGMRLDRIPSGEMLARLAATGSPPPSAEASLRAFLDWATSTPAYLLTYGDTAAAVRAVESLA